MTELDDKQITKGLEEIRDRVEAVEYDDATIEDKLDMFRNVLESGDDIVYVLDQAIESLTDKED